MKAYPVTNKGWFEFYRQRYDRTGSQDAAHLALLYFLNTLKEQDDDEA